MEAARHGSVSGGRSAERKAGTRRLTDPTCHRPEAKGNDGETEDVVERPRLPVHQPSLHKAAKEVREGHESGRGRRGRQGGGHWCEEEERGGAERRGGRRWLPERERREDGEGSVDDGVKDYLDCKQRSQELDETLRLSPSRRPHSPSHTGRPKLVGA
eukprot:753674-Hanusia_phi.AAC.1